MDVGAGVSREELAERLDGYDGILIRSATKLDAELLERATRLRVVGRAGVGVDNVDVAAATKRGIVVANAPQSNVITAAEHTMALLLALARNIPQAHASLTGGAWERSRFSGIELHEKTLGILGFGRIGQLVSQRARGFGMHVVAFDPFVAAERYRELGVEKAQSPEDVYAVADFLTLHLPNTPETEGWLDAAALASCKPGVRVLNVARGPLVVEEDLRAALDSGQVGGAALDVFGVEPVTDHPLFGYPNVIVTPHLGASTAEATDRAGYQAAEQVVAALTGGVVTSAVNIPAIPPEDMDVLGPFVGLCRALGRIAVGLAPRHIDRARGKRVPGPHRRARHPAAGHPGAAWRAVRAHRRGGRRGQRARHGRGARHRALGDQADKRAGLHRSVRVTVASGPESVRVVGTLIGHQHRPYLLEAWGQRFMVQLEENVTLLRYRDIPGMIGRVGTSFGASGINIVSAAVGRQAEEERSGFAVMVITTDGPVPTAVLEELLQGEEFVDARTVTLDEI